MIVAIGTWLTANWKVITVAGVLISGVGGAAVGHVSSAETRLDALEVQSVRDSASFDIIQQDVSEIKCMVVQNAQDEDPLDCIE